ncbi:MAG: transcription antitermination factor NusB [Clostridia bacterium]|nr:transcription antitermination factor NusB [Clostridia bacterium]
MRALAREVAFKKIFETLFTQSNETLDCFFENDNLVEQQDRDFANLLVNKYLENQQQIESLINNNLVNFVPERVYRVDRAILSTAVCELFYVKETPLAVVINEAVKMAKKYGTDKSYAFVNGVLKSIIKEL